MAINRTSENGLTYASDSVYLYFILQLVFFFFFGCFFFSVLSNLGWGTAELAKPV